IVGLFAFLTLARTVNAQQPAPSSAPQAHGQIKLRTEGNARPIELKPEGDSFTGSFAIQNVGGGPLNATPVGVRTSPTHPRVPPGVSVELEGGGQTAKIPPDGEKRVIVRWKASAARAQELYGHVLVESDSVPEGAMEPGRPVAMGIFAQKQLGLGVISNHILS